jgi:catechol-2,3-dioxygenase
MALDHHVSQGLYVSDPDGNLIELYVDADERTWRGDPTAVANSDPLTPSRQQSSPPAPSDDVSPTVDPTPHAGR